MTNEKQKWTVAGIAAAALIFGWMFLVEFVVAEEPSPIMFAIFAAIMVGAVVAAWIVAPKPDEEL